MCVIVIRLRWWNNVHFLDTDICTPVASSVNGGGGAGSGDSNGKIHCIRMVCEWVVWESFV